MRTKTLIRAACGTLLALAAPAALAHTGGETAGLAHGLGHPFAGADHLLAMLAVGLWAAQQGGHARWAAPALFLGMMGLAAAVALTGPGLPLIEPGIAGSVLVFGLLILAGRHLPAGAGLALIGGFALFHGYAHGAEMPLLASGLAYGLGFTLATAALHGTGYLTGLALRALASERLLRLSGLALSGGGLYLLGA